MPGFACASCRDAVTEPAVECGLSLRRLDRCGGLTAACSSMSRCTSCTATQLAQYKEHSLARALTSSRSARRPSGSPRTTRRRRCRRGGRSRRPTRNAAALAARGLDDVCGLAARNAALEGVPDMTSDASWSVPSRLMAWPRSPRSTAILTAAMSLREAHGCAIFMQWGSLPLATRSWTRSGACRSKIGTISRPSCCGTGTRRVVPARIRRRWPSSSVVRMRHSPGLMA